MPQESTPRRERKRTVQQMVLVGVIASAAGIALGLSIHWFPPADSTQADKVDTLWDVLIIATVPVFVLVTVVVLFSVLEFRMRPGEENLDGPPIHGNTTFREHLTAIRMDRAAEMLGMRGLTVREVAHRVGYRQPAQFAKAFRRHHGTSPSTFRAQSRDGHDDGPRMAYEPA